MPEALSGDPTDRPLRIELRCTACGKRMKRRFAWASITLEPETAAEGWDGIVLSNVVECRGCGAVDEYEVSSRSKTMLLLRAMAGADPLRPGPVIAGKSELWDGTLVRRPSQAIEWLRKLTRERPDSAEAHRRLGNLCERFGLREEALASWRKACDLDDGEVEAAYSLARCLLRPEADPTQGFSYLRRALAAFPLALQDARVAPGFGGAIVGLLQAVVESTDEPMALRAAWRSGGSRREPELTLSDADLREVEDFDRLADLVSGGRFLGLELIPDLPERDDEPTFLERLLEGDDDADPAGPRQMRGSSTRSGTLARAGGADRSVAPDAVCRCGSGKKYRRCCGRAR